MKKGDYIVFNCSFNIKHVGVITHIEGNSFGVFIVKSLEKSNLNTANLNITDIEMKFDSKPNLATLEDDYPELYI